MADIKDIDNLIDNQSKKTEPDKRLLEVLNKYFKLILILVGVIILYIGYYFVIVPKWEVKSNKETVLLQLEGEVNKLKSDGNFLSQYSSKIIEFTPDEERKLNLALPSRFDLSSIVVQLSRLASEYKFIVENIEANEVVANGLGDSKLKRVDINMTVISSAGNDYGNFGRFIEALESSLMIFDVKAISFSPDEVGYKLELSTYYYPSK